MSQKETIRHINDSGGLAFAAHPGHYLDSGADFNDILEQGFDGIEVLHPQHKQETIDALLKLADGKNLLVSGGSDFHGFPGRDVMGEPKVPYSVFESIKERLQQRSR